MFYAPYSLNRFVLASLFAMLVLTAASSSDAGLAPVEGWGTLAGVQADPLPSGDPISRLAHRLSTRVQNTTLRLADLVGTTGVVWVWLLGSALVFLLVAAVSSAVDVRMLTVRRRGWRASSRYLGHGTLTFLRILRDRQTPNMARLVLAGALLYWLLPIDLIADNNMMPGFVDDLLVAVAGGKAFVYLCPDALVATHATAVEAHA